MTDIAGLIMLVPGLLQPPRGAETAFDDCPELSRWLAGSMRGPGFADTESALAALFRPRDSATLSLAALRYAAEPAPADAEWVAFADPVHLRVDPNRALLFGPQLLQLADEESAALVEALNQHLEEDQLRIAIGADSQWYIHGQPAQPLQATALGEVVGRNAEPFLPHGQGASYWRRLLNEIQMLLHAHPVNERRTSLGQPTVSGIWPWSAGQLPGAVSSELASIVSDDPALMTLAGLAGVRLLTGDGNELVTGPQLRVDLDLQRAADSGDVERWCEALRTLETRWRSHLQMGRRLRGMTLWPTDGFVYRARPWRPWRRHRWPGFAAWRDTLA